MAKIISKAYGEALFELALEKNELDSIAEQVNLLVNAFAENPELIKLLSHPKINKEEKVNVIETIFKGRMSDDIVGFLVIIVEKDRGSEIADILNLFQAKVREYKKIGVALVTSAIELSTEQKQKVEQKLLQQTAYESFEVEYKVDASLIGGMIIRIGDRVVDSSIRSKLDNLTKELRKVSLV